MAAGTAAVEAPLTGARVAAGAAAPEAPLAGAGVAAGVVAAPEAPAVVL